MDRLKKQRTPLRAAVTRTLNEIDMELSQVTFPLNAPGLEASIIKLEDQLNKVKSVDEKVIDALLDIEDSEIDMDEEQKIIDEYEDKVRIMKLRVNKILYPVDPVIINPSRPHSPTTSDIGSAFSGVSKKRTYKLPKIEIRQFDGELKNWLSFWSQFERIHLDEDLHESDKFQYLVQAMTKDTKASKLVQRYPQCPENYNKVIQALKDRFGDKTLLAEVYVRELLKFVNTGKFKEGTMWEMYDELESHLRTLQSLGVDTEQSAFFLYPMLESSLPIEIFKVWQRSTTSGYDKKGIGKSASERLTALLEFLEGEVKGEERLSYVQGGFEESSKGKKSQFRKKHHDDTPTAAGLHVSDKTKCLFCKKNHDSEKCGQAQDMTLEDKRKAIRDEKRCDICLRAGHWSSKCKVFVKCPFCSKRHVALMCPECPANKKGLELQSALHQIPSLSVQAPEFIPTTNSNLSCSSQVILKTLMVTIMGKYGKRKVRALIDDGSQRTYILKRVAEELGLDVVGEEKIIHALFSGVHTSAMTHKKFQLNVCGDNGKVMHQILALSQDKICGDIPRVTQGPWMKELKRKKIWISDLGQGCPEIELLIGADVIGSLATGRQHKLENGLTAMQFTLGWTLIGKATDVSDSVAMTTTSMLVSDMSIQQLWDLETIGIRDPAETKSQDEREEKAKLHFEQTVKRLDDGRYSVSLPWINEMNRIPDNRRIAEKRLESATKKLIDSDQFKVYEDILIGWLKEGIIEEVSPDQMDKPSHYLPHRAVFKPDSATTPVRPVFDASCKSNRSPSLNDCLEKGPNLLDLIPSILTRFREGKLGVISDIRKAFLMIDVREEDRNFLRFLWWGDADCSTLKVYRHKRVVFGVNCSPFLLGAVIELHLKNVNPDQKKVAEKLLQSLYVDNCVTSVDSFAEYEDFKDQATHIMAEAKMDLRLWQCSSVEDSRVGSLNSRECGLETTVELKTQVLGMNWYPREDFINCDVESVVFNDSRPITKRSILSGVQKIFDPLGFLSPVLLEPKKMLQKAWELKTGWDDELPQEFSFKYKKWLEEISALKELKIPRNFTGGISSRNSWQLHTFVDASKDAFAAVVFLRSINNGVVSVQLLQSKARVKPLKKITIPRMELLACTVGTRLADSLKTALSIQDVPEFYWTDSSTALAWIQGNDEWGTFVGNRVREILKFTRAEDWYHVPGIINPADLPSRGCKPSQFLELRWWEGPSWLKENMDCWPSEISSPNAELVLVEKRKSKITVNLTMNVDTPWYVKRYSSFKNNVRVFAWMRRYLNFLRGGPNITGSLTLNELDLAERKMLKVVQDEAFPKDAKVISGLRVEKDEDGLFRVKTKLLNKEDSEHFRYPILLPHNHPVTEQIIREEHLNHCHSGIQFLMGNLREAGYWIIQGRKVIRSVVSNCMKCKRFTVRKSEVVPAALPEDRVNTSKVFEVTGVDLAGPLFLKKNTKVWIVVFTCAVYRCVHLELVESLSTEAFLDSFERFCMRRGRPSTVYSDNGTNFVGADNVFKKINWIQVENKCGMHRIRWRFNPPSAAWWGGWWERLIRSIKDLLRRTLGKRCINYVKMLTYLCEIEACINGRPLTTVTEDPEDLIPLTPAMFLHEIPAKPYSDLDFITADDLQSLNKERKDILDEYKMRFRREYLALLVQREKEKKVKTFNVGDVVLVGADNKKRWEWPLARIIELLPGKDNNVRVARLKTQNGILIRPVQRLYSMEVPTSSKFPFQKTNKAVSEIEDSREPKDTVTRYGRTVKVPARFNY